MVSANPTGPITVASARNGALGDSVARLLEFAGHDGRARVLLQRRRRADGALPAPRSRRSGAARSRPRTATTGAYIAELAAEAGRPGAADARADRGDDGALPDPLRLLGAGRASSSGDLDELIARLADLRAGRGRCSSARPSSATTRTASLLRSAEKGGLPTYEAADVAYLRRQARARLRPGDLRPRRRPPRRRRLVRGRRADARLRPRPGRGAPLPARPPDPGRRADEDVEAPRRRRLPRRPHRRGRRRLRPLVPRRPRPRPDDRHRRRPRRRAVAQEPRLLRPVRPRPDQRDLPRGARRTPSSTRRRGMPLAPEERELVKRLAEFPGVVREATERRGPHAIPVYAIRLADDFHRFYHEHVVLAVEGRRARVVPARADRARRAT